MPQQDIVFSREHNEVEKKYQHLFLEVNRSRGRAALVFYNIVKDEPEVYSMFNDPRPYNSRLEWRPGVPLGRENANISFYIRRIFKRIYNSMEDERDPGKFFKMSSTELKFFAEHFPILYLKMFERAIYQVGYNTKAAREARQINRIPYLKPAYQSLKGIDLIRKHFDKVLLIYYRYLKKSAHG